MADRGAAGGSRAHPLAARQGAPPVGGPVVGVDVGGTKVRAALASRDGGVITESEAPTDPAGGRALVEQIAVMVVEVAGDV